VIEGARESNDGRIVAEVYGDTLWMRRRGSSGWIEGVRLLAAVVVWIVRVVARVVGPNAKGAAVDEAELVVREVNVLETLANKGLAVNLVDVTVA